MIDFFNIFRDDGTVDVGLYRAWYAQEFAEYLRTGQPESKGPEERRHAGALAQLIGLQVAEFRAGALADRDKGL